MRFMGCSVAAAPSPALWGTSGFQRIRGVTQLEGRAPTAGVGEEESKPTPRSVSLWAAAIQTSLLSQPPGQDMDWLFHGI